MRDNLGGLPVTAVLAGFAVAIALASFALAPFVGESYWQGYWISVLWLSGCALASGIFRFIYREFLHRP
ncbi:hypothetical protein [Roseibium sediminis]|uniref:hypothetical protein n=1 Tax=Roseibium sediminis TaxID=1775174 RepID=UPI00123CBB3B|nr:hypothetical protein [Roseibium sediminis]